MLPSSSVSLSTGLLKKHVVLSPSNPPDLTSLPSNDLLRGNRRRFVSPLTEILAYSPAQLQPLSAPVSVMSRDRSEERNDGKIGVGHATPQTKGASARTPAVAVAELKATITSLQTSRHDGSGDQASLPEIRLRGDTTANSSTEAAPGALLQPNADPNGSQQIFHSGAVRDEAVSSKKTAALLSQSGASSRASSQGRPRMCTIAMPLNAHHETPVHVHPPPLTSMPASQPPQQPLMRARSECPDLTPHDEAPVPGESLSNGSRSPDERRGTAAAGIRRTSMDGAGRAVDHYGLPNALQLGQCSLSTAVPHSPSIAVVSPNGISLYADTVVSTSSQAPSGAVGTSTATGASGGMGGNFNVTRVNSGMLCSASPRAPAKQPHAPRLASHLFLDETGASDNLMATVSLQSPAMSESKHRSGGASNTSHSTIHRVCSAALDLLHTPHACSDAQSSSLSADGLPMATVSLTTDFTRPSAANFVKGELIGKGSYGAVYRGMQRNNNRIIAMKEIRLPEALERQLRRLETGLTTTTAGASPAILISSISCPPSTASAGSGVTVEDAALAKEAESIRRELTLLKKLNHPNIVRYLNSEMVDGSLRIYMDFVSGGSVTAALKSFGSFEEPQAAALCFQLLQGLVYMHRHGIVHRDLKGDNLLLETSSQLKIADLGTAKSIMVSATATTKIVGTAYFMAPEVLQGKGAVVGTAADIWSVVCCVIEMLTGKPPLSDLPNQYSVMMAIGGSNTVPLHKYIPPDNTWSEEVLDFIAQGLRLNPAERPSAVELLQHRWFTKHLSFVYAPSMNSTPATLASVLTPLAPPNEKTRGLVGPHRTASPIGSPDAVTTLSPCNDALSPGLEKPGSRGSSRTSRERKKRRDRQLSSGRHHARDASATGCGLSGPFSHCSLESYQGEATPSASGTRYSDTQNRGGGTARASSPHASKHSSHHSKRKRRVLSLGLGVTEDASRGASVESAAYFRTPCSVGATGGESAGGGSGGSKGSFLPAITLGSSGVPSPSGYSLDALHASRSSKLIGSSREATKAYYPPDSDSPSPETAPLLGISSGRQTLSYLSRDTGALSGRYEGGTKAPGEGGSNVRGPSGINAMGDLEGFGDYMLPSGLVDRRSTSRKKGHDNTVK